MEPFDYFRGKCLADFIGILRKQLLDLVEGEVRQIEFVLDIKRRDGPVIVQLGDIFHADDSQAVDTPVVLREVDAAE